MGRVIYHIKALLVVILTTLNSFNFWSYFQQINASEHAYNSLFMLNLSRKKT